MKIDSLEKHHVSSMNSYMFDTNVWLYIYGPMAGAEKKKQGLYASLLREIADRNAGLFITSMVLSEYINRVLRMSFELWKRNSGNFTADYKRDYRGTEDFKDSLADIKAQVKEIMSNCMANASDDFNSLEVNAIIDSMSNTADFNDVYLVSLCESRKWCFVSDDKDIQNIPSNIKLITA